MALIKTLYTSYETSIAQNCKMDASTHQLLFASLQNLGHILADR